MGQNIIDFGFDLDKWNAEKKVIYEDLMALYELAKKINDTKIGVGSAGGWAEMKSQVEALKAQIAQLQEANVKLAQSIAAGATAQEKQTTETKKATVETGQATASTTKYVAGQKELLEILVKNESASKALTQKKKELESAFKSGAISERAYLDEMTAIKQEQIQLSVSSQGLNVALKNIEKGVSSADGSLVQMRSELNLSLMAFDKLSAAERKSVAGQALQKKIKAITDELNAQEQATGRYGRQVGNYAVSAKIIVDAMEKAKQKSDQLTATLGPQHDAAQQARLEYETLRKTFEDPRFMNISDKSADASKQLRFFTQRLIEMEQSGVVSKEVLQAMRSELGKLTDSIADAKDEIKALSSDTRKLDLAVGALKFGTDIFQAGAAAAHLFGKGEEDAAKAAAKFMAIQSLATGVQSVATELTTKGTAANKAYAYVQGLVKVATDATATSTARLNALMKLSLIGAAIGLIVQFASALGGSKDNTEELNKELERLNKNLQAVKDSYNVLNGVINYNNQLLINEAKRAGKSEQEINKIVRDGIKGRISSAESQIKSTKLITEAEEKRLKGEEEMLKVYIKFGISNKERIAIEENIQKRREANNKANFEAQENLYSAKLELDNFETETIVNNREKQNEADKKRIAEMKEAAKETAKIHLENMKRLAEEKLARNEMLRIRIQERANQAGITMNNEEKSFGERLQAQHDFYDATARLSRNQYNIDIQQLKAQEAEEKAKANSEIKGKANLRSALFSIEQLFNEKRKLRAAAFGAELLQIDREASERTKTLVTNDSKFKYDKMKEDEQKRKDHQTAVEQIGLEETKIFADQQLANLEEWYQQQREKNKYNEKQLRADEKEYAREKLRITFERDAELLRQQIATGEKQLEIAKALAELETDPLKKQAMLDNISKAGQALDGLKIQLQNLVTNYKAAAADIGKTDPVPFKEWIKNFENLANIAKTVFDTINGFVTANIDRQKSAIEELAKANEKYGADEEERINNSTLSEEEKAARVKILKAEVEEKARQLDARQRERDIAKAKFDKAAAISNIIMNTAVAISHALKALPFSLGDLIFAAATGAAQLAVAVSTQIPSYAEGTDNHPGGPARYGEAGPEKVELPGGKSFVATEETISWLPRGTKVTPLRAEQINDAMYGSWVKDNSDRLRIAEEAEKKRGQTAWKIARWQTEEMKAALAGSNKKTPVNILNKMDFGWADYINKNIYGK